jgi:AAHS family 4-hydroxybenzoate transporter-like MFS transporter
MAPPSAPVDVSAFLDERRFGRAHMCVIALLILTMLIDSYDIFVVGAILPLLADSMHVLPQSLTSIFVLQQLALLIGTFLVGPLSDRFGRRTTLLVCVGSFVLLTFATVLARTPMSLLAIRFVSSLFLAGVIPNAIALSSELAPKHLRAGIVSVIFCGFTGGRLIEAFVQAFLLERFGWESAFLVGGGIGLLTFVLLWFYLPESILFRTRRDPHDPRIAEALLRIDPSLKLPDRPRFVLEDEAVTVASPAKALFSPGMWLTTILLWVAFLTAFVVNHLVGSWNTTVLHDQGGISLQHIAAGLTCGTVAGIIGTLTSGFVLDRFGARRSLPVFFLGAAVPIAALGWIDLSSAQFLIASALSGYFINSALGAINAFGALVYPSSIRATGVAWAAGAGRAGGMIGPAIGGLLLAQHANIATIYLWTAAPLLLGALAVVLMPGRRAPAPAEGSVCEQA